MKNGEIVLIYEQLLNIGASFKVKELPCILGYAIEKNLQILYPYYQLILQKYQEIGNQYGEYQEDGNFKIESEKINIVNSLLENLKNETQYNIEIYKISIQDIKNFNLSFERIEMLMPILKD